MGGYGAISGKVAKDWKPQSIKRISTRQGQSFENSLSRQELREELERAEHAIQSLKQDFAEQVKAYKLRIQQLESELHRPDESKAAATQLLEHLEGDLFPGRVVRIRPFASGWNELVPPGKEDQRPDATDLCPALLGRILWLNGSEAAVELPGLSREVWVPRRFLEPAPEIELLGRPGSKVSWHSSREVRALRGVVCGPVSGAGGLQILREDGQ